MGIAPSKGSVSLATPTSGRFTFKQETFTTTGIYGLMVQAKDLGANNSETGNVKVEDEDVSSNFETTAFSAGAPITIKLAKWPLADSDADGTLADELAVTINGISTAAVITAVNWSEAETVTMTLADAIAVGNTVKVTYNFVDASQVVEVDVSAPGISFDPAAGASMEDPNAPISIIFDDDEYAGDSFKTVTVTRATLTDPDGNVLDILNALGTTDNVTYSYTHPGGLAMGDYTIVASGSDEAGNEKLLVSSTFTVTNAFLAGLDGAQEVPPVDTPATGLGRFTFNTAQTELAFSVAVDLGALSGPVTAAHFHGPAPIGANAGIVRAICTNQVDCASAFTGTVTGTWGATDPEALTPGLVEALLAGNLYVNVHTSAHPGGEIRGQIERLICGDLNGDGGVNVFDAIIELQIIVGLIEPTEAQIILGDVVRDGTMNVFDAILVLQHIVGLTVIIECGPESITASNTSLAPRPPGPLA